MPPPSPPPWTQSWTILFLCIHTDESGRRSPENPCWLSLALYCSQIVWGIQSWISQLSRWSLFGSCSFGQERAKCSFWEENPQRTAREIRDRCDVSIGTAERTVRDDFNLKKMVARWISYLLTDQQKKQRVECSRTCVQNVWIRWTQTPLRRHSSWNQAVL